MNISCKVIRDLLPLYHDDVCSDESRSLVEEHLNTCAGCAEELRRIDEEMNAPHIPPENETARKAISSAWKKAKKKSFSKGIIIAALICALLIGAFIGLTQWKGIPVSADVLELTELSELPDGSIVFHLFVNDNKNLYFIKFTVTDDGCFYLTPMHSIIEATRTYDIGGFSQYHVFYPSGNDSDQIYPGIALPENVKKIYVGPVGDGTLVWEAGMVLPEATDVLEQKIRGQ